MFFQSSIDKMFELNHISDFMSLKILRSVLQHESRAKTLHKPLLSCVIFVLTDQNSSSAHKLRRFRLLHNNFVNSKFKIENIGLFRKSISVSVLLILKFFMFPTDMQLFSIFSYRLVAVLRVSYSVIIFNLYDKNEELLD